MTQGGENLWRAPGEGVSRAAEVSGYRPQEGLLWKGGISWKRQLFLCGNIPGENGSLPSGPLYVTEDLVKYIP